MTESQPAERVRALLEQIVTSLELEAEVNVEELPEEIAGRIDGDDVGIIIGRHGQTIDAIQHVAYRVALRAGASGMRVSIDAGDYRERRAETIERMADSAAEDAIRYGRPVSLDAMTASERKLAHEYLRDRSEVETYSEGDEPQRHLVVAPLRTS